MSTTGREKRSTSTKKKTLRKNCGFHRHSCAIPPIIEQTCEYLEQKALQHEGLFRIPGSQEDIRHIKDKFEKGKRVDLSKELNPNTVAGVLKLFFTELSNPIMTYELYPSFVSAVSASNIHLCVWGVRQVLDVMPPGNRIVLCRTTAMFATVAAFEEKTKMSARNIALVMNPSMFRDPKDSIKTFVQNGGLRVRLIEMFVAHHDEIFKGSREDLDDKIRQHVEFTPEVEEHLLKFSQELKRNTILLATALMEEGETEMAVCFDSFNNVQSSIDEWKRTDKEDTTEEDSDSSLLVHVPSDALTRGETEPVIAAVRPGYAQRKSRPREDSTEEEANRGVDSESLPILRGDARRRAKNRKMKKAEMRHKNDSTTSTSSTTATTPARPISGTFVEKEASLASDNKLAAKPSGDDKYLYSDSGRRRKTAKPRADPLSRAKASEKPFRSSARLFFDPRSTEEILKELNVDPGKIFEMMLLGNSEGVKEMLANLDAETRFLLIFRLQRAATDLIVTLDQVKM